MSDVIVQLHVRARLDRLIDDINRKTPGKSVHCFFGTIHRFIMGYRVLNFRACRYGIVSYRKIASTNARY